MTAADLSAPWVANSTPCAPWCESGSVVPVDAPEGLDGRHPRPAWEDSPDCYGPHHWIGSADRFLSAYLAQSPGQPARITVDDEVNGQQLDLTVAEAAQLADVLRQLADQLMALEPSA